MHTGEAFYVGVVLWLLRHMFEPAPRLGSGGRGGGSREVVDFEPSARRKIFENRVVVARVGRITVLNHNLGACPQHTCLLHKQYKCLL